MKVLQNTKIKCLPNPARPFLDVYLKNFIFNDLLIVFLIMCIECVCECEYVHVSANDI